MSTISKLKAFSFASLLAKPFVEWDAYKLGIIDEKGNLIKKPSSREEQNALDTFENLVRKIKRLLIKYIPDTRLFSFLISTYLLKTESDDFNILEQHLSDEEINNLNFIIKTNIEEQMPLPKPEENEDEKEFISRCMLAQDKEKDLKDSDTREQALAICYSIYRKANEEDTTLENIIK